MAMFRSYHSPLNTIESKYRSIENIELKMKCILCSYCDEKMKFTTAEVKRSVPAGAQDLNIYDEIYCWRCPKCNQMSQDHFIQCEQSNCDGMMLDCENSGSRNFTVTDDSGLYGYFEHTNDNEGDFIQTCHLDLGCALCDKSINDKKFVRCYFERYFTNNHYKSWEYFHCNCYAEVEKRIKKEEKEKLDSIHIRNGQCINCGNPLGFFDKISGRQAHKSC